MNKENNSEELFDLKLICDRCLKTLDIYELVSVFEIEDDFNYKRTYQGHNKCILEAREELLRIYKQFRNEE